MRKLVILHMQKQGADQLRDNRAASQCIWFCWVKNFKILTIFCGRAVNFVPGLIDPSYTKAPILI